MSSSEQSVVSKVLKGGSWLYLSNILNNIFGFVYWFVISIIGGPSVLGYTSAVIGLASIIIGLLNMGSGIGLQKYIGEAWGQKDRESLSTYFWSTTLFSAIVYFAAGFMLMLLALSGFSYKEFSPQAFVICSLLVALGFNTNFTALFTAVLKTNIVALVSALGNVVRLAVGITLVIWGWSWVGASLGYVFHYLVMLLVYLYLSRLYSEKRIAFSLSAVYKILKAGSVSWLPNVVTLLGQWLGVLVVFGSTGAVETGAYYIAFTISSVVVGLGLNITMLLLPVLSSLTDGRKRVCWSTLKVCYALILPLAFALMTYPWAPLKLLRREYVSASSSLFVLLASSAFIIFVGAVTNLLYAYNGYMKILALGAALNIPRIVLYFILVPPYGGYGAALSFLAGSITGFLASVIIAKNIGFTPSYKTIACLAAVPLALSSVAWTILRQEWIIGVPLIIILSYIMYIRLNLISKNEVKLIVYALTPSLILNKVKPLLEITARILF